MTAESKVTFNPGFLKESAKSLAKGQSFAIGKKHLLPVKPKLDRIKSTLEEAYRTLALMAKKDQELSPASEWLIDNFYIIQEQIVQVETDFPREYQQNIPILTKGEHRGYPRVYELVLNLLTYTDLVIDAESLTHYVQSFQEEETLMIGEVWAIPIMVRFALLQLLSERAERVLKRKNIRSDIVDLIKELSGKDTEEPGMINYELSRWFRKKSNTGDQLLLTELANQLQVAGMLQNDQKRWLAYKFNKFDVTTEEALRIEAQKQSKLQVSIQNAIISLRYASETDWSDFVEECSIMDQMLRLDPLGSYPDMDFQTRDTYRRTIERLSRRSDQSETEVTEQVLLMAEEHARPVDRDLAESLIDRSALKQHVGYYLVGEGYSSLIKEIGYSMPFKERVRRRLETNGAYYLIGIFLITLVLLGILWVVTDAISRSPVIAAITLLVALFPALDLSVSAVNRFIAFLVPPRVLPKMDYDEGIPEHSRTMVVVPTMISSPEDARRQLETLEIRSLANPDKTLQFALLTDFQDADEKNKDGDREILDEAERVIEKLNNKYRSQFGDKFFLLHRERLWNEKENKWMGWERKRGKLEEFNKLICEPSAETSYTEVYGRFGETIGSDPIRFVMTLDSDTRLPPDSAVDLVRTISHPLNRAYYDPEKKRVTKGYSIIQPRISIPPDSARNSYFSYIFSGNVGLDPYSTAVSDIYQDLIGEAVFTGKGIYDVQAFHLVMDGLFPENRILSHDLIESTYLRAGLVTDVELFDDYPSTYVSYSKRNHRWARGDWQIAAWLFRKVPGSDGKKRNRINLLSKWKIFDNLRRSMNPFFLTLFFIAGWFWLPGSPVIWTLAALGILAFPIYISLSTDIANRPARLKWRLYFEKIKANLRINSMQTLSTLIVLPHQAVVQLDAIVRTLWRLKVSKKWLLEWTTASQTESQSPNSLKAYLKMMIVPVLLGLGIFVYFFAADVRHVWVALPFGLMWLVSPWYAWYISGPMRKPDVAYSAEDEKKLRSYARRTWFYFERFVNEKNSWLPPDNYQEDPSLPPFARTSPTNIGLSLTSNQVAYNMGYITFGELLERNLNTLKALEKLERYKGHFYNWYEITLGEVLHPRYISTVDSGNLAAGLITVKEAVKHELNKQRVNKKIWNGLEDTVLTVREIFREQYIAEILPKEKLDRIELFVDNIIQKLPEKCPRETVQCLEILKQIKKDASNLSGVDLLFLRNELGDDRLEDLLFWLESPLKLTENAIAEFRLLPSNYEPGGNGMSVRKQAELIEEEHPGSQVLKKWVRQVKQIVDISERLVHEMDFSFLYIKKRGMFSIGFNVDKAQADAGTYDLLASEARIASYIAIAKGDIPSEHWFRLSRRLTSLERNEILLSWGGTMFEYLMPLLFMRSFPNTLLSHTYNSVLRWQQIYGSRRGHPWGASESAYYFLNMDMHYQYKAFGVPGLGLKRGLADEYVIAPYATMLSLMVEPKSAIENLKRIENKGGLGLIGFYDALDFTPSRLKEDETCKVVKTYMAHHHGMSLLALENLLNGWTIHHYFHSDPQIKGCDLLLQERVPRGIPIKEPHPIDVELEPGKQEALELAVEHAGMHELDQTPPRTHILSNGSYSSIVSHAGTGYSRYHEQALTAWIPDTTTDPNGLFFYIKDKETGKFWSSHHQPVRRKPDRYDTWFHNGKMVTSRVDQWIETTTEICVSPDHPIELRKLTLTNYSDKIRRLEITSYAEVVLNRLEDHNSHPAFSKLFVQTDYLAQHHSVIAKRRPRSEDEKERWMVHTFAGEDPDNLSEPLQFETERSKFIGRGRSLSDPDAMEDQRKLSGTIGNVSDPILSLRKNITLGPGEKIQMIFGIGWADSYKDASQLADIYDNRNAANRAFDLATVYSTVELEHIGITSKQAHYFQKLASYLIYSSNKFRADSSVLMRNHKKQKGLWAYGISGDLPLLVFGINDTDQLKAVKTLLKAHAFWRLKGLNVELLILNDHPPSYADEVQEAIQDAIQSSMEAELMNKKGGVFVQRTERIQEEDLVLIQTVAHAVISERLPRFSNQEEEEQKETVSWIDNQEKPEYQPVKTQQSEPERIQDEESGLIMFNGIGGFSKDGSEYHVLIKRNPDTGRYQFPPAPWVNVISNPKFGFIATEKGAGYTWSENSRENKLTKWSNDPVKDPHSEAFYLRDEGSKRYWSPMPGPVPGGGPYRTVHGFGYSRYHHDSQQIRQQITQYVSEKDPVKISVVNLKNTGDETRRISIFRYQDWVLGVEREQSVRHVIAKVAKQGKAIYASNPYNNEFAGRIAFSAVGETGNENDAKVYCTNNRERFIGRNHNLNNPAALQRLTKLDNEEVIGSDICAAFQVVTKLNPGEEKSFVFLTGETEDRKEADRLIELYSGLNTAEKEFRKVKMRWRERLSRVQVKTPDPSMNVMVNGWLMYQNISSRMWARTAYYQAGGAFGFRDQLQDSMAILYSDPELARQQILRHAEQQFREGDVLHWWHPPTGRGIRSKISDDRLWLPYVTAFYISFTGDRSILEEKVPYIEARKLEPGEHEVYLEPETSYPSGSLYEHCCKAIDISLEFGRHELPLIGAGDWNDGMNRVGAEGRGESVWLGFFQVAILEEFRKISKEMGEEERAEHYGKISENLKNKLNHEGWDGNWYLRAYYDDGTPLGSSSSDECRIDAISQAWSVITGVASEKRGKKVLAQVEKQLISEEDRIIRLLTPPFDKTEKNPGYIKGYIPGVRENGGQYTHAALWTIKAFAEAGLGGKAVKYYNMINPVNHTLNHEDLNIYKVEPYVVAADVYGEQPLTGQGGWTWYTGSAGWMYRVAVESILGLRYQGDYMEINPSISSEWEKYRMKVKPDDQGTVYDITVENPNGLENGKVAGTMDGKEIETVDGKARLKLFDDGEKHVVKLRIG